MNTEPSARLLAKESVPAEPEAHGAIVRAMTGDVIAFCPPLIIERAEIDELMAIVGRALEETAEWLARSL
jgi:4-aminobutyrate--pyruvate transaminase